MKLSFAPEELLCNRNGGGGGGDVEVCVSHWREMVSIQDWIESHGHHQATEEGDVLKVSIKQ